MIFKKRYPIKFQPIFKEKIWGGNKLKSVLGKKTSIETLGESWEISDVDDDVSIVANGDFKGQSLQSLLKEYKSDFIGIKNYQTFGNKFPLLIKFIDAKEDLSIQLHPNNELAAKRHNSFGKTEMWYVMQADIDANLIVGFNEEMTSKKYLKHLSSKTLPDILNFDKVKSGDAYFIDVGRIHAIGAGVMLAEIQQTSDITYRVYDWDRVGVNGNSRDLHNDLAIDAINFNMKDDFRISYSKIENKTNKLVTCTYFTVNYLSIQFEKLSKKNTFDSFIIYICVEGEATIEVEGFIETIKKGETILMPAAISSFQINAESAELLEVYI
ncbi:type I phosphomannose isomerase catalytic subunit [Lacinutrix sp. Bg11-31]|uniref:type I phosphomannose isomerase catalytic subunit n=1 Tax=Lacinutrix sp. Bg11-31 TaxID=2057808 RepID=UPI000C30276B|nr:type I phosphomannose isomerase catalytic subunit [Lacinutrix sp. Bg11-31]AUC80840.1 mannose-6-phosphate isomerase [Lacinutrix sp. Bg11-31]